MGPTERDDVASVIMYQERSNSKARICEDGSLDTIRYYIIYVLQLLALASSLPASGMSLIHAGHWIVWLPARRHGKPTR
jgi:hypothetical protein